MYTIRLGIAYGSATVCQNVRYEGQVTRDEGDVRVHICNFKRKILASGYAPRSRSCSNDSPRKGYQHHRVRKASVGLWQRWMRHLQGLVHQRLELPSLGRYLQQLPAMVDVSGALERRGAYPEHFAEAHHEELAFLHRTQVPHPSHHHLRIVSWAGEAVKQGTGGGVRVRLERMKRLG